MGGHVFFEYMSFRMTSITGTIVLREVMLCRRTCLAEVHVFRMTYPQDDVSYWNACYTGGQVFL